MNSRKRFRSRDPVACPSLSTRVLVPFLAFHFLEGGRLGDSSVVPGTGVATIADALPPELGLDAPPFDVGIRTISHFLFEVLPSLLIGLILLEERKHSFSAHPEYLASVLKRSPTTWNNSNSSCDLHFQEPRAAISSQLGKPQNYHDRSKVGHYEKR